MKSFEDFISKAKGAVDVLGEKAGQFVDVSKLNLKLLDFKSQVKSALEELGEMVYKSEKDSGELQTDIKLQVKQIDELYIQIEKLKVQIAAMKNKILCKSCGYHNDVESDYCAKCGKNLKENVAPEKEACETEDDFAEFDD